jgi:hypothetical protein
MKIDRTYRFASFASVHPGIHLQERSDETILLLFRDYYGKASARLELRPTGITLALHDGCEAKYAEGWLEVSFGEKELSRTPASDSLKRSSVGLSFLQLH